MNTKVYPRTNDFQTIYLNTVIKNPYCRRLHYI